MIDHNEFDRFAAEHGWYYDNGWRFKDEFFACSYAGFEFIDTKKAGYSKNYLRLLRHDKNGLSVVIHIIESDQNEIWRGSIGSKFEFLFMLEQISGYIGNYKNKLESNGLI